MAEGAWTDHLDVLIEQLHTNEQLQNAFVANPSNAMAGFVLTSHERHAILIRDLDDFVALGIVDTIEQLPWPMRGDTPPTSGGVQAAIDRLRAELDRLTDLLPDLPDRIPRPRFPIPRPRDPEPGPFPGPDPGPRPRPTPGPDPPRPDRPQPRDGRRGGGGGDRPGGGG